MCSVVGVMSAIILRDRDTVLLQKAVGITRKSIHGFCIYSELLLHHLFTQPNIQSSLCASVLGALSSGDTEY